MDEELRFEHFLIRESSVLVRVPLRDGRPEIGSAELFDVRTGVQLKEIHPPFLGTELDRAFKLPPDHGEAIIRSGAHASADPSSNLAKVVSILEARQRRLDHVVADSIIGQVGVIRDVLDRFLSLAGNVNEDERFWLSQQVLPMISKFTGRELEELDEIVTWMGRRPRKD
jgi:hypothetical protein